MCDNLWDHFLRKYNVFHKENRLVHLPDSSLLQFPQISSSFHQNSLLQTVSVTCNVCSNACSPIHSDMSIHILCSDSHPQLYTGYIPQPSQHTCPLFHTNSLNNIFHLLLIRLFCLYDPALVDEMSLKNKTKQIKSKETSFLRKGFDGTGIIFLWFGFNFQNICKTSFYADTLKVHSTFISNISLPVRLSRLPDVFVAVISGRSVTNVKEMVGIEGITYAGNHGLEIIHPGIINQSEQVS